jgi:hypothetical protein
MGYAFYEDERKHVGMARPPLKASYSNDLVFTE